ncbi:hypothetical protein V1477_021064 [Vespula maculifrons]|uniref:Uncharacterized protein n=1 Tax=Vespula maculifrons TaxID=7453 RepID=A0ABD2AI04_VESMC
MRNTKRNKDGCRSRSPEVLERNRIDGYVTYEYFRGKYAISITLNVCFGTSCSSDDTSYMHIGLSEEWFEKSLQNLFKESAPLPVAEK